MKSGQVSYEKEKYTEAGIQKNTVKEKAKVKAGNSEYQSGKTQFFRINTRGLGSAAKRRKPYRAH